MSTTRSLDEILNDLVHEADNWANSPENLRKQENGTSHHSQSSGEDDESFVLTPRQICLDQITRTISAHITDMLMQRLGIDKTGLDAPKSPVLSVDVAPSPSPISERKTYTVHSPRCMKPFDRRCACKSHNRNEYAPRYRSENRLDRSVPPPRKDDTPLENRASRLRRVSAERRIMSSELPPSRIRLKKTINSEAGL